MDLIEMNPEGMDAPERSHISREAPEISEARRALVSEWSKRVSEAREYWSKQAFRHMVEDMRFAAGRQWGVAPTTGTSIDMPTEELYTANIVLRHIAQRTASIYGKNPRIVARRKPRLNSQIWDGSSEALQNAIMAVQSGSDDPMAALTIEDAMQTLALEQQQTRMARTLELLFEHEIDEQPQPFKVQMKATVRRGLTTGVGYVKLGYQRVMARRPEDQQQLDTAERQLAALERLAADRGDGEFDDDDARMEQLRLLITELSNAEEIVVREGLLFTYPHSTAIIPDPNIQQLRGFVGADWVAEEYFLTRERIMEVYQIDPGATSQGNDGPRPKLYERLRHSAFRQRDENAGKSANSFYCVWEIYNKTDGLVYTVCDGYPEFLTEPSPPDVYLERFYPWFPFVINEVYDDDTIFPPSDVRLMRPMQLELNRSRQGLREHRIAARPRNIARKGTLSGADKTRMENASAHDLIELDGLGPSEKIEDVIMPWEGAPLRPELYDPSPAYEDYLRTLGQHEAHLGGTSGATATESAIAEGSRETGASSVVDDLDEFLTELARAAGVVLLLNMPRERVQQIVGPGAVWPDLRREEVAREIYLEVEAASTGRPNRAAEVQTAQQIFPLLMQLPGLNPEKLGEELLRRLDDKADIKDFMSAGAPSVQMLNALHGGAGMPAAGAPGGVDADPAAQGAHGAQNAPDTDPGQVNTAPRPGRPPLHSGLPVT